MEHEKGTGLSDGEWRVMEVLWESPRTLMELVRELKERAGWAKSPGATVAGGMEDKGLLRSEQAGRAKVFYPCVAREEAAAAETESLLTKVYRGSVGLMVNTLVQSGRISKQELDELYQILEQAEEGAS